MAEKAYETVLAEAKAHFDIKSACGRTPRRAALSLTGYGSSNVAF